VISPLTIEVKLENNNQKPILTDGVVEEVGVVNNDSDGFLRAVDDE